MNPEELLERIYNDSIHIVGSDSEIRTNLDLDIVKYLDEIIEKSESAKAVLTVILTSAVYKIIYPNQDIRNHQTSINNGYSGRTFDAKYITPFLKNYKFPAMSESGWLTRSLEQKVPYDFNYSGAIKPDSLKTAFLTIIDYIQKGNNVEQILSYLIQGLIIKRNLQKIELAKPHNLQITTIIDLLIKHFGSKYAAEGASRLPVLAIYAAYQCLISELKRYNGKTLLPLESHTSSDLRSGRIGDIDIIDDKSKVYEAVEVKHGIPITTRLINDAYEKFKSTQVNRYYLLSTADIDIAQSKQILSEIERIKNIHGCHVIANGVISSLKYYLRLINNTSDFIELYVSLLENDLSLKFEHKAKWNDIISKLQTTS